MTISIVMDEHTFEYSCNEISVNETTHPPWLDLTDIKVRDRTGHYRVCAHNPVHTEFMVLELIIVVTFRRKGGVTQRWHVGLLGTGGVLCPDLEDVHVNFIL